MSQENWNTKLKHTQKKYENKCQITELHQCDFDRGTYIINCPGLYRLCENISFNPNSKHDWNPHKNQKQYQNKAYLHGFFAAIAIESDHVVLDLNGYTIEQSLIHSLQQRFFAVIELGSSPFPKSAGPADFGELVSPSYVKIFNGTIGRSSHHGVHGNEAFYIQFENLTFKDFEVAAVSLNGGGHLLFDCLTIGPNNKKVPVLGTYSAARFIRPFIKKIIKRQYQHSDSTYKKGQKLLKELEKDLDLVKKEVLEKGLSTHPVYGNPLKRVDGNNYALLISPSGPAVNDHTIEFPDKMVQDVTVRDITIKNISVSVNEIVALSQAEKKTKKKIVKKSGCPMLNCQEKEKNRDKEKKKPANSYAAAIQNDPVGSVFQIDQVSKNGKYHGHTLSDVQLYVAEYGVTPEEKGGSSIGPEIVQWAKSGQNINKVMSKNKLYYRCNGDSMFHVNKGHTTIRLEGIYGLVLENIKICGSVNHGKMGSLIHHLSEGNNHPLQHQVGYQGSSLRGILISACQNVYASRLDLRGLKSYHGYAYGIHCTGQCSDVKLSNICVNKIYAGNYKYKQWRGKDYHWQEKEYTNDKVNPVPIAIGLKIDDKVTYCLEDVSVGSELDSVCKPIEISLPHVDQGQG